MGTGSEDVRRAGWTMPVQGATAGADLVRPAGGIAPCALLLVAGSTLERRADPFLPPLRREDPGALPPRGAVAHMLAVAALEQGHPVPSLVLLESGDGALHAHVSSGSEATAFGVARPQRQDAFGVALLLQELLAGLQEVELRDQADQAGGVGPLDHRQHPEPVLHHPVGHGAQDLVGMGQGHG